MSRLFLHDICPAQSDFEDQLSSDDSGSSLTDEQSEHGSSECTDSEGDISLTYESSSDDTDSDSDVVGVDLESPSGDVFSTLPYAPHLRSRNILTERSRVLSAPRSELHSFLLFYSEDLLRSIMRHTNRKIVDHIRHKPSPQFYEKQFAFEEFIAAFGLLIRAGLDRDNGTSVDELWSEGGKPFYKATMSRNRFKFFLFALRFDNYRTREERKATDRFAAVRDLSDCIKRNLIRFYVPDETLTVDEQLVGYRGRVPGRVYMPQKPRKYGLKVFWVCEASSGFALNFSLYGGREENANSVPLSQRIVMELVAPFYGTGREIVTDRFFTSLPLARSLLENKLTLLGTLRASRREVPPLLRSPRGRDLQSTLPVYEHNDRIVLLSYVPKKNRNVLMLSSGHEQVVVLGGDKKPNLIVDYNNTKSGVDRMDAVVEEFTTRRQTRRWPMLVNYNFIDISANNAFLLYKKSGYLHTRRQFLNKLSLAMVTDHINSRLARRKNLSHKVKMAINILGFSAPVTPLVSASSNPTHCRVCRKGTRSRCDECGAAVCPQHRSIVKICRCEQCNL